MITIKVIKTKPSPNHRFNSVSVINVCNYSLFQFNEGLSNQDRTTNSALLNHYSKPLTNISKDSNKSSKEKPFIGDQFGDYVQIKIGGKIKWKHKFKNDMPLKDKV